VGGSAVRLRLDTHIWIWGFAEEWRLTPFVRAALWHSPIHEAPLVRDIALRSREIILKHNDPADRFLAATASVYDLTLVTADERLLHGTGFETLANR
jgi:PIN domain nuclease of toxin-antitoxin system